MKLVGILINLVATIAMSTGIIDEPLGAIPLPTAEDLAAFPPPPPGISCVSPQVWWTTPAPGLCDCWNRKYASLCTYPGTWDKKSCSCRCSWWAHTLCPKNQYLDPKDCKCKCKDPPQCRECSFGQIWNDNTCKCECPPVRCPQKCPPNRYFNHWTCQCECKQAPRSCCPESKPFKVWSDKTCNCECKFIKCCNTAAGYSWGPYLCKCVKQVKWWPIDFPTELARIQESEDCNDEGVVPCSDEIPDPIETTPVPTTSTTYETRIPTTPTTTSTSTTTTRSPKPDLSNCTWSAFEVKNATGFSKKWGCLQLGDALWLPASEVEQACIARGMRIYTIESEEDMIIHTHMSNGWRGHYNKLFHINGKYMEQYGKWYNSYPSELFAAAIPANREAGATRLVLHSNWEYDFYFAAVAESFWTYYWCEISDW